MKTITPFCLLLFIFITLSASSQTKEELKQLKTENLIEVNKYQAKADSIQKIIDAIPGWRIGAFGTIGGSLSNFSKWYAQGAPNNQSGTIGLTINAFANKIDSTYFWRNNLYINSNWTKLDNKDNPNDSGNFEPTIDIFNLTSLYGYKLSKNWAVSTLAEYRTTLLNNINNPGYLDVGVGFTWTPYKDLVVVIHPANYNFVFSENGSVFESSLGAKIVADYTRQIGKINFKTNLSAFQSYEESELSNWTWVNSFSYSFWKGIGLGIDFGLRSNHQEAVNFEKNRVGGNSNATFDDVDNDIQSYYTVGVSYNF